MRFSVILRQLPLSALCLLLSHESAYAFGKKAVDPNSGSAVQAVPTRMVELAHVTVPNFYLPNGNRVDMNTDLRALVDTEINQSANFRTVEMAPSNRLVVTGGVTSLELDALQLNLKIGWSPSGALPIPIDPAIKGEVDLRLSNLSMDFKIYDRMTGETYLASYTNETLSNLKFSVRVEISQIGGSIELLTKTKLADAIRQATRDIFKKFSASPGLHYVPWETRVLGIADDRSTVTIGAGGRQGIVAGAVLSVYSNCEQRSSSGMCFERFLADIRARDIGQASSMAIPNTSADSLNAVETGDKVYVKVLNPRR